MSIDIHAMAHEVCYGATGKVRAEFIALAKANGYEGHMGGWIYRTGSTKPAAQGWAALAKRVARGTVVLRTIAEIKPVAIVVTRAILDGDEDKLSAMLDAVQAITATPITPGAVVTIHTGTRQYDVTQVDWTGLDLAMVWPRDPSDYREGQWVSLDLLHIVPPAKVVAYALA